MTDEELEAIEARRAYWDGRAACDDCACMDDIPALVAEVRRLRAEPSLQISLAEGQSYVTPTGWRIAMRDGTMVMDHEKVRVSYEYWNEAEQRWQAGAVENGPGR